MIMITMIYNVNDNNWTSVWASFILPRNWERGTAPKREKVWDGMLPKACIRIALNRRHELLSYVVSRSFLSRVSCCSASYSMYSPVPSQVVGNYCTSPWCNLGDLPGCPVNRGQPPPSRTCQPWVWLYLNYIGNIFKP